MAMMPVLCMSGAIRAAGKAPCQVVRRKRLPVPPERGKRIAAHCMRRRVAAVNPDGCIAMAVAGSHCAQMIYTGVRQARA